MDFAEINETIEKLKNMNEEELSVFINVAVARGLTDDPNTLRQTLLNLRKYKR